MENSQPAKLKVSKGFILTILAIFTACYDFFIRASDAEWTSLAPFQWGVTYSPIIYIIALTYFLLNLKPLPLRLNEVATKYFSIALLAYSIFIIYQIFTRHIGVGSASYSIVSPLFLSGIPAAILTFVLYFNQPMNLKPSIAVIVACLIWIFGAIAIDTMYLTQGGYRGYFPQIQDIPVLGTCYDFMTFFLGFGVMFTLILSPFILIYMLINWLIKVTRYNHKPKLKTVAIAFSLVALGLQICNWGNFIWD